MLHSLDLRIKAMKAIQSGLKKEEVSKIFNVCRKTIYNWINLEQQQGNLLATTGFQKGYSHKFKDYTKFKSYVNEHSDYTQEEIALFFNISSSTVSRALNKIGYSRKKKVKLTKKGMKKNEKNT
jgi:transposase